MSLREVSEDFDWEHYIESNFNYKAAGNELRVDCVNCGESEKKLYINIEKGMFNCFKCDFRTSKQYSVFDFVALAEGITKREAICRLEADYRETTPLDPRDAMEEERSKRVPRLRILKGLPNAAQPVSLEDKTAAAAYLLRRGLDKTDIAATQMHYVPDGDFPIRDSSGRYKGNLRNRILYPVYGGDRDLVSWQSRTLDPASKEVKYLACPESDLAKTVWPFCNTFDPHAILVEGVFDALAVRRAGLPAYATFTKHISAQQLAVLRDLGVRDVTLFFDKSDAKKEMISTIEKQLTSYFDKVYVPDFNKVHWPSSLDAGDCLALADGSEKLQTLLRHTIDVYSVDFYKWKLTS